jgi:hypothetical protein
MHALSGLRLGVRRTSREALGWPACLPLRRRWRALSVVQRPCAGRDAAAAGRLQDRGRQERLATLSEVDQPRGSGSPTEAAFMQT